MSRDLNMGFTRQLSILIREIEKDPSLTNTKKVGMTRFDRLAHQEQWQAIAAKLNSVKNGKVKTAHKWQRKCYDLMFATKKKVAKCKDGKAKLTDLECRILDLGTKAPNKKEDNGGIKNSSSVEVDSDSENDSPVINGRYERSVTPDFMRNKNQKRRISENETGNIKKQRVKLVPEIPVGTLADQISDGLTRLISLKSASRETEEAQTKLLENIAMNLIKVNVTLDRHADIVNKRLDNLEQKILRVLQQKILLSLK